VKVTSQRRGHGTIRLAKALPKTRNYIASKIGEAYAEFVRRGYLSGQVLAVRRGVTRRSAKFFKQRAGVFGVRPGVGVPGRLNYLARFERRGRSFMGRSARAFKRGRLHERIARKTIAEIMRRSRV
jgi:hypothetical protein